MPVFFNPFSFIRLLIICLSFLIIINVLFIVLYYNHTLNSQLEVGLYKLFYVDRERNIPSFFNMLLLLVCAILNVYVFLLHKHGNFSGKYYWLILAAVFFFLAFDESVSVHESLTSMLPRYGIGGKGAFTFAWVIPYGIAAILSFMFFFRFLLSLPVEITRGFILSGAVFVTGAIGVEMFAAKLYETRGGETESLSFALLSTIEEVLEMTGLILFAHYILKYISKQVKLLPSKSR